MLVIAGALLLLLSLVRWGGLPEVTPRLVAGIGLLMAMLATFGLLLWWLYLSPVPADVDLQQESGVASLTRHRPEIRGSQGVHTATFRQFVGALATISGLLFVVGGAWDEVWHRRFGSFGNDFLWAPHLLLYGSLGLIACFAGAGLALVLRPQRRRRGAGQADGVQRGGVGLRQRFRAEPAIGWLALVSGYLVLSVPSDLLWHLLYGIDLTAWSLPHLMLAGGFTLVMLAAVAVQLSRAAPHPWQGMHRMTWADVPEALALLPLAWAMVVLLQLGTTEWDGISVILGPEAGAFWQRPEWLYPVVVVTIAIFAGAVALHALRRAGAATVLGLLVLGARLAVLWLVRPQAPEVTLSALPHLL
ncbi:MAG: hypothetical protein ACRDJN_22540, partial [Chloroflexota bacterium]